MALSHQSFPRITARFLQTVGEREDFQGIKDQYSEKGKKSIAGLCQNYYLFLVFFLFFLNLFRGVGFWQINFICVIVIAVIIITFVIIIIIIIIIIIVTIVIIILLLLLLLLLMLLPVLLLLNMQILIFINFYF